MSKRVASIATLFTLAFVIAVLGFGGYVSISKENMNIAAELSMAAGVAAESLLQGADAQRMLAAIGGNLNIDAEWFADIASSGAQDALKEAYERATEGIETFSYRDAKGGKVLCAIYRFEDGSFFALSRPAYSLRALLGDFGILYGVMVAGVGSIVYLAVYIAELRKQHMIKRIMNVLEEFSEGKFETRLALLKGDTPTMTAQYNAVIARIEDRIFRQRGRNHALSAVMNQMQNGVIAVDDQLRVMLVTPLAKKLLGITGNPEGLPVGETSKDVNLAPVFSEAMQHDGVYTNEVAARTTVGRGHRPLRLYVSPMRQDGKVVGVLAMIEDITELRRLEQVRTDFAANVSHELKTPLTSIKGFVETLLDGALHKPEMAEKFLKIIMLETDRLTRLINDILSITKLESGSDEVAMERIRIDKMAYEVADMLQIHASEKDVTIEARMNKKPVYVMGNPDRVEQMLINLIENGIKYNKPGGKVTVQMFENGQEVSLTIADTGIGIAEEHMVRLFERFYRVDKGRSRSMGGTGLGLAIVKHIIRTMGGSIEAHSVLGQGTEFLVTLPLALEQSGGTQGEDYDEF